MFMPPWADNHSYATESAGQCKNGRFSLPLQCIKETRKITVHSRVRADIKCADRHHPAASDGGPVVSHTQHPVGNRVPRVALHVCFFDRCATAPETRPLPAVSRAHPPRDVDRLYSGVRREGAVIPRPVVRGPMAVALPQSRSVIGRERRRVRPMIAPPPSRSRRRSNSDHPGKSSYSGKIDYWFLTFQTGNRLTSLVTSHYTIEITLSNYIVTSYSIHVAPHISIRTGMKINWPLTDNW